MKQKTRFKKTLFASSVFFAFSCAWLFAAHDAQALDFGWLQERWQASPLGGTAAHPGDQSDFTDYTTKSDDVIISGGAGADENVSMDASSGNPTDTSAADFSAGDTTDDLYVDPTAHLFHPQKANGYACENNNDNFCQSGRCDATCQAKLSLTQSCDEVSDCLSSNCTDSVCSEPTTIVWVANGSWNGDLKTAGGGATGRAGANNLCLSDNISRGIGADSVKAFLSTSGSDEIRDLPTTGEYISTKPVYWYRVSNGAKTMLASNWADMLSCGMDILASQFTGTGDPRGVHSGSVCNGATGNNCWGYTLSNDDYSDYGVGAGTNYTWFAVDGCLTNMYCSTALGIRCIGVK